VQVTGFSGIRLPIPCPQRHQVIRRLSAVTVILRARRAHPPHDPGRNRRDPSAIVSRICSDHRRGRGCPSDTGCRSRSVLMSPGDWGRRTIQIVKWAVPLVAHGQQLVVSAEYRIPTMHGVTCGLGDSFERHRRRAALTDQPSPGLDRAVGHGSPTWVDPAALHGLVQCAPRRSRHLESVRPSRAPAGVQSPTRSRTGRAPLRVLAGCPWL